MKKKLQKPYPTDYNLLKEQDLWQSHYQVFSINLLKEFLKLNVNKDTAIANVKRIELDTKVLSAIFNKQALKTIYWNTNDCVATRITKKSLMKT